MMQRLTTADQAQALGYHLTASKKVVLCSSSVARSALIRSCFELSLCSVWVKAPSLILSTCDGPALLSDDSLLAILGGWNLHGEL